MSIYFYLGGRLFSRQWPTYYAHILQGLIHNISPRVKSPEPVAGGDREGSSPGIQSVPHPQIHPPTLPHRTLYKNCTVLKHLVQLYPDLTGVELPGVKI